MQAGEEDFYAALKCIGGCSHIPLDAAQTLDGICKACRTCITKLVLLRDHYNNDRAFFR